MQFGLQLHLPTYRDWSAPALLELAAEATERGIDQIWLTDNLGSRHALTLLGAMAREGIRNLGWAVMVQYLRSPLEAASGLSTVAELIDRGTLDVALGVGNPFTGHLIRKERPIAFMAQTAACLRAGLAGDEIVIDRHPLVRDYFGYQPGARVAAAVAPQRAPVRILGGGNGPLGIALAARQLDGLLMGWTFISEFRLGRLPQVVAQTASRGGDRDPFLRVAELKLALDADGHRARRWVHEKEEPVARRCVSLRRRGWSDDELQRLGLDPRDVATLDRWDPSSRRPPTLVDPDAVADACFVAGDPDESGPQLESIVAEARRLGFAQLMFSELGPDPRASLSLLGDQLLPRLRTSS